MLNSFTLRGISRAYFSRTIFKNNYKYATYLKLLGLRIFFKFSGHKNYLWFSKRLKKRPDAKRRFWFSQFYSFLSALNFGSDLQFLLFLSITIIPKTIQNVFLQNVIQLHFLFNKGLAKNFLLCLLLNKPRH